MANENDSDEGRAVMPDYRGCVFAGSKDGKSYGFYLPDTVVDEAGNISLTDYVVRGIITGIIVVVILKIWG